MKVCVLTASNEFVPQPNDVLLIQMLGPLRTEEFTVPNKLGVEFKLLAS